MILWDDEQIETLRQLWTAGHSAAEIALKLKRSRNSIIGKLHYLNMLGDERFKDRVAKISLGSMVDPKR